jgi:EAL domain-containing protein (putative c-di-GMP-specific phosphodiesterase class I)
VNVSAAEFQSKDFLSGVRAALIATGLEPQNLELELTETVLMQDADSAVLLALKARGCGWPSTTLVRAIPALPICGVFRWTL